MASRDKVLVLLNVENVLEYWLDANHYFGGDYYAYDRAPVVLVLDPGDHVLNIRLIRDVRLFGARSPPALSVVVTATYGLDDIFINPNCYIVPDIVNGQLTGDFISVATTNTSSSDISVRAVTLHDGSEVSSCMILSPSKDLLFDTDDPKGKAKQLESPAPGSWTNKTLDYPSQNFISCQYELCN